MKKETYIRPMSHARVIESETVLDSSVNIAGGTCQPGKGGKGTGSDAAAKPGLWDGSSLWDE